MSYLAEFPTLEILDFLDCTVKTSAVVVMRLLLVHFRHRRDFHATGDHPKANTNSISVGPPA